MSLHLHLVKGCWRVEVARAHKVLHLCPNVRQPRQHFVLDVICVRKADRLAQADVCGNHLLDGKEILLHLLFEKRRQNVAGQQELLVHLRV